MIVNGSFTAEVSARYSLAVAKACGGTLELLYVAGHAPAAARRRGEESLLRVFRQAQAIGLAAKSVIEAGEPVDVMRRHVIREQVALAVVPITSADTARRLLREIPCPLLLVRVRHLGRLAWPHEILVPVYPGEFARSGIEAAARLLAQLARYWAARIVLFQVRRPLTRLFDRPVFGLGVGEQEEQTLRAFAEAIGRHGLLPGRRVVWGRHVGRGITAEAAARRHDLIFLATGGPGGFLERARAGTIAHLVHQSPCDLMLFRPTVG